MKKLALIATLIVGSFATQQTPNNINHKPIITNKSNTIKQVPQKQIPHNIKQGSKIGCNISQTPGLINNCIINVETEGIGVAPTSSISPAQATAMARRAAIIDGYKALTEKLYGIKINGRETVRNMVLQNSNLRSKIAGVIRGAVIEEEEYKNGMYRVVMSLKFNVKNWNKYLKENPPYSNTYYDYYN
jgi:hypothetical protein